MHLAGGGGGGGIRGTPVHRDPDIDELHYNSSGPAMGTFLFTPHGADHGWEGGYTKKETGRKMITIWVTWFRHTRSNH